MLSPTLINARNRIKSIGLSDAIFARTCGLSPTAFSNVLREVSKFDGQTELHIHQVSVLLCEWASAVAPLRLPDNSNDLRRLLDYAERNGITTESVREYVSSIFGLEVNSSDAVNL